ncbi:hypothetical protein [uncultured Thiothrix sp.]|uniref:hypothetical protein n=1 Tax=uncultured Thiothrix sp. TaxID=223185 RepID=UPI00262B365E|nr:hypothetical protein [uncultured Thiothrix sp.]
MGLKSQHTLAVGIGIGATLISYYLVPELDWIELAFIGLSGFVGVHLPNIQQPSSSSYWMVRLVSIIAALCIPLIIYAYRPSDLLIAWLATYLLFQGAWWIVDRISLYRDYTHSLSAIIGLPAFITLAAYISLDLIAVLPVFLASSTGYVVQLLTEQRQKVGLETTGFLSK